MKRKLRKARTTLRHLGRLIAPLDVLYHVGNVIYRRSLRYTAFTAGIAVVGRLAKQFDLPGLTARQALLLPLTVGAVTLLGGLLLKLVPSLISARLLNVAQANDLNLMEDYRKSEIDEHLRGLWQRIFRHECRLRLAAGLPALPGCEAPPADGSPGEALADAEARFLRRARRALETPQPQIRQMHAVGLDLRYLEDWRDGAYLDRSDTKLVEQFDGNATLLSARREVGLIGPAWTLRFRHRQIAQRLWFSFLTRLMAIQIGTAVSYLNARCRTDLFNSQVLLWPGEEDQPWLAELDGAREVVLRRRKRAVRRVFGNSLQAAGEVLDHMLYPAFAQAAELRMRYDPDYCDGRLGYDVVSDLQAEGRNRADLRRCRRFAAQARRDLETFDELLRAGRGELLQPDNAEALRAVRIAYHVNEHGLKRRLLRTAACGIGEKQLLGYVRYAIDRAVADRAVYTRRLLAVRLHHELTRLARKGYYQLVRALAYAD